MGQAMLMLEETLDYQPLMVRVWPDDTFDLIEDIRDGDYDWKSDDYQDVDINNSNSFNALEPSLQRCIEEAYF